MSLFRVSQTAVTAATYKDRLGLKWLIMIQGQFENGTGTR